MNFTSQSSVIEKTIAEETDEEDRQSTNVGSGAKGSGGGAPSNKERGGTISIKINGHMREVVIPNSVSNWWRETRQNKTKQNKTINVYSDESSNTMKLNYLINDLTERHLNFKAVRELYLLIIFLKFIAENVLLDLSLSQWFPSLFQTTWKQTSPGPKGFFDQKKVKFSKIFRPSQIELF